MSRIIAFVSKIQRMATISVIRRVLPSDITSSGQCPIYYHVLSTQWSVYNEQGAGVSWFIAISTTSPSPTLD